MILQNWWYTTLLGVARPICPPLRGHVTADVAIVGGGAAGLAAALRVSGQGLRVVLLERNICGGSTTGKSAGFLTPDSELELSQLVRRFGEQGARDLWACASDGVQRMVETVREHHLDCDLVRQDSLFVADGRGGLGDVREEVEARRRLGFSTRVYDEAGLASVLGSEGYAGGVRYDGTYGIDALRYAQGVKQVLLDRGVAVYESSEAVALKDHTVHTHLGSVTAGQVLVCIDKPEPRLTDFADNVYHAQTFLAISEPLEPGEIRALFPEEPLQCWDTDLIYTYWRLTGSGRLLVGGGSKLATFARNDVTTPRLIRDVLHGFVRHFPALRGLEFIQYWPGRIDTTRDLIPTLLRDPERPWVHVVLGCVGLPWATFCGRFAAEHVLDDSPRDDHKYYRYFALDRGFLVPLWMERFVGKRLVFSLNNAYAKYYQVDRDRTPPFRNDAF